VAVWSGERGREGGKDRERGGGKRKGVFVFVIEGDLGACTIKLFRAKSYAAVLLDVVFVTAGDGHPGLIGVGKTGSLPSDLRSISCSTLECSNIGFQIFRRG
jgi:hypothetical protein